VVILTARGGLACFEPALRDATLALRQCRLRHDCRRSAARRTRTAQRVAAERGAAALLDRRHDLELSKTQVTHAGDAAKSARGRGRYPRPPGRGVARAATRGRGTWLQWTDHLAQDIGRNVSIEEVVSSFCGEQHLDHAMSTFCSSRWVAKLWRSVWSETRLSIRAARAASCTARFSCRAVRGSTGFKPGNSQPPSSILPGHGPLATTCAGAWHHRESMAYRSLPPLPC